MPLGVMTQSRKVFSDVALLIKAAANGIARWSRPTLGTEAPRPRRKPCGLAYGPAKSNMLYYERFSQTMNIEEETLSIHYVMRIIFVSQTAILQTRTRINL
jgi:hypothetical protein